MSLVKHIFSLAAVALLLVACGEPTPQELAQEKISIAYEAERMLGFTAYVYDKRSNLCLLRSPTTHHHFVYVPVKCTPEVEKLLLNPPE